MLRHGSPATLYELKCYTPFVTSPTLGERDAASTAEGGRFALGNTEEALRKSNLGHAARGEPNGPAYDRRSGRGYVRATAHADYADALAKGHRVVLLVCESTGALSRAFDGLLRRLGRLAVSTTADDYTLYGASRSSPASFYSHHYAAVSCAAVFSDVTSLHERAASLSRELSLPHA